jgi:hypothetical protein
MPMIGRSGAAPVGRLRTKCAHASNNQTSKYDGRRNRSTTSANRRSRWRLRFLCSNSGAGSCGLSAETTHTKRKTMPPPRKLRVPIHAREPRMRQLIDRKLEWVQTETAMQSGLRR